MADNPEARTFAAADTSIAELKERIARKVSPQAGGIYLKEVGVMQENVFLSPIAAWKIQCGYLGFSLVLQPDRSDSDNVEMKLTYAPFSNPLCDAVVPEIGAFVRARLARSN